MGNHEWITSWFPDQHNDKDIAILKYDFQCLNLIYILQKMNNLDLHQPLTGKETPGTEAIGKISKYVTSFDAYASVAWSSN